MKLIERCYFGDSGYIFLKLACKLKSYEEGPDKCIGRLKDAVTSLAWFPKYPPGNGEKESLLFYFILFFFHMSSYFKPIDTGS